MNWKYQLEINWSPKDRAFIVKVPELPGCLTHGETVEEAVKMADEAISLYLESLESRGIKPPKPFAEKNYSGKLVLRLPRSLHRDLAIEAHGAGVSLNRLIERKLGG